MEEDSTTYNSISSIGSWGITTSQATLNGPITMQTSPNWSHAISHSYGKLAIYAGSFNPWHKGHQYIYEIGKTLFDHVLIIKAHNSAKADNKPIQTYMPEHYTIGEDVALGTYCQQLNAKFLLRGVRVASDYDYEFRLAAFNQEKFSVQTVFVPCSPNLSHITSSALREFNRLNVDISEYLAKEPLIN